MNVRIGQKSLTLWTSPLWQQATLVEQWSLTMSLAVDGEKKSLHNGRRLLTTNVEVVALVKDAGARATARIVQEPKEAGVA